MKRWPTLLIIVVGILALGGLAVTLLGPLLGDGMGASRPFEQWYGNWPIVTAASALFVVFLLGFSRPRGAAGWRTAGMGTAFFIALFTEMFGVPLTIFLLTGVVGGSPALFGHMESHLWAFLLDRSGLLPLRWGVYLLMALSMLLISGGVIIAAVGWRRVYQAGGALLTDGLYGWVRHPQYAGFTLVILGFLIQWPTLPTLLMAPVLLVMYARLARWEEERLREEFGAAHEDYVKRVGGWWPRLRSLG